MSASLRARVARVARAVVIAAGGALLVPGVATAHAIGSSFQLPVPRWLYLGGAALVVAASFVVSIFLVRPASANPTYRRRPVPPAVARMISGFLAVLGLAWWFGAIW